jgi:putative ABC transport system permease protein
LALTKSTAIKLFGDEDALKQQVKFMGRMLTVSAIIPEFSKNSSFNADFILNIRDKRNRFRRAPVKDKMVNLHNHYVLLAEGVNPGSLAQKINHKLATHLSTVSSITFQPIQSIYLNPDIELSGNRRGSKTTILVFIAIAVVILLLSIINYIQFSISYHFSNIKSIGLKMFNGAGKKHIYQYYLTDTAVLLSIALVIGFILMKVFIPFVNPLFSGGVNLSHFLRWPIISVMTITSIIIIGLGGYLPLFVLSKTDIKSLLSNSVVGRNHPIIKGIYPIIQFACAIILLISTFTIQKQLSFVKKHDLGFAKHNLLQLEKPGNFKSPDVLKQKMLELPFVENVSWSYGAPAFINYFIRDTKLGIEKNEIYGIGVDKEFLKTFDISLLDGRDFMTSDLEKGCYVNEAFLKMKNWTKPEEYFNQEVNRFRIVGVVNDFSCNSLHETIIPTILYYSNTNMYALNLRLLEGDVRQQLSQIESVWNQLLPGNFFNYKFYDDVFDNMYKREEKLGKAISLFSLIAFFITAMGLLGMIMNITILRTKEIGVRKVNGAKVHEILQLINTSFIKWVSIAFVIATPIAYFVMSKWLENFAYKTDLSWWIFALAGLMATGIALLTVSWQSWKAATRNPVEALRYE